MCGIVGIVAHHASLSPDMLARATQSLVHRGPDDSGTIILRDDSSHLEVGLGNRRLAILDLSPLGHQPMHDPETGNWIVYNGEIYNFRDVRCELERLGTRFISHSDTEVVLKAYALWGERCLDRFRGMFAFAIWDSSQHRLFIARDPMGIKPLYYAQAGSYFIFASEVRTLLGTGLIPPRLDPAGLTNYLTFGSAYDPLTVIQGIQALPPAHVLTWAAGQPQLRRYWDLVDGTPIESRKPESAEDKQRTAAQMQTILEEAVQMQLVSDVPVGVFLSGGIDSSALVSILSRHGITPSTFSIIFREADFSEAQYSRTVAARFQTDHHEIDVTESDFLSAIPGALSAMDLPTMDGVNAYFVSRETRNAGVKVALSGLGGDEIFAGYSTFRTVPRMERFVRRWQNLPQLFRNPVGGVFGAITPRNDQNRKLASLMCDNGRILHPYFLARMLFTPKQRDLLLQSNAANEDVALGSCRDTLQQSISLDSVNRVSYLEARCYMANTLLRDADFMSMSQGLEVRVPLIDHVLAKNVLSIPGDWKINRTPKKLLVDALHGSLPDEIVHRLKRGFTLPFAHWIRQELRTEITSALESKRIDNGALGGLLNGHAVKQVWEGFLNGSLSWSRPWALYVLLQWCELNSVSA